MPIGSARLRGRANRFVNFGMPPSFSFEFPIFGIRRRSSYLICSGSIMFSKTVKYLEQRIISYSCKDSVFARQITLNEPEYQHISSLQTLILSSVFGCVRAAFKYILEEPQQLLSHVVYALEYLGPSLTGSPSTSRILQHGPCLEHTSDMYFSLPSRISADISSKQVRVGTDSFHGNLPIEPEYVYWFYYAKILFLHQLM